MHSISHLDYNQCLLPWKCCYPNRDLTHNLELFPVPTLCIVLFPSLQYDRWIHFCVSSSNLFLSVYSFFFFIILSALNFQQYPAVFFIRLMAVSRTCLIFLCSACFMLYGVVWTARRIRSISDLKLHIIYFICGINTATSLLLLLCLFLFSAHGESLTCMTGLLFILQKLCLKWRKYHYSNVE